MIQLFVVGLASALAALYVGGLGIAFVLDDSYHAQAERYDGTWKAAASCNAVAFALVVAFGCLVRVALLSAGRIA
jgi:hypothetical protein